MNVQTAIEKRFSTRDLDKNKKISTTDINTILAAGIKAPNGYGIEGWKFSVLSGDLSKLKDACYGQEWIDNASHAIVISAATEEMIKNNPSYLADKCQANGFPDGMVERILSSLENKLTQYTREQTYFAAAQIILQATELGIGTVAVGGYEDDKISALTSLDSNDFAPTLVIVLGYSNVAHKQRNNRDFDEVVNNVVL